MGRVEDGVVRVCSCLGPVAQLKIIVAQQDWQLLMAEPEKCKSQLRVDVVVGRAMGNTRRRMTARERE
jgi:hypothetical protein